MSLTLVLGPVLALISLTLALNIRMGWMRVSAVRRGEVKIRDIALGERNWPPRIQQTANAFHNQFELPVLFYLLTVLSMMTHKADFLFIGLSWLFVVLRMVHANIMINSNHVPTRMRVHMAALLVLIVMWAIFAVRILIP
jgi:hypothetical protein